MNSENWSPCSFADSYILVQADEELLLVDQHVLRKDKIRAIAKRSG